MNALEALHASHDHLGALVAPLDDAAIVRPAYPTEWTIAQVMSHLGSGAVIAIDDRACMVQLGLRVAQFYMHESCGKCTPCREGTDWLFKILQRIERGEGEMRDLDLLSSISGNIAGKTLCAFGDAAVTPVLTTLKHFRHEYEAHIKEGRCTLPADWRARQPVEAH